MKTTISILLAAGMVWAALTFKYKCDWCGLVQEYSKPGMYICPTDEHTMTLILQQP